MSLEKEYIGWYQNLTIRYPVYMELCNRYAKVHHLLKCFNTVTYATLRNKTPKLAENTTIKEENCKI